MCTLNFILKEDTAEALRQAQLKHLRAVLEGLQARPVQSECCTWNERESAEAFEARLRLWHNDEHRRVQAAFVKNWIVSLQHAVIAIDKPAPVPSDGTEAIKYLIDKVDKLTETVVRKLDGMLK